MAKSNIETFIICYTSEKPDLVFKDSTEFFKAVDFHIQFDAHTIDSVSCSSSGRTLVVTLS